MKVDPAQSHAPKELLDLAVALVAYLEVTEPRAEQASKRMMVRRFFEAIWPQMYLYPGHTHYRIMPLGTRAPSVYVDFAV